MTERGERLELESRKIIRFRKTIEFGRKKGNTALLSMVDIIRDWLRIRTWKIAINP